MRQTTATRRGKSSETVESIKVASCEGKLTKACGSFVYLGTLTKPSASATPEIRRRIGMALGAFGSLSKIWKSKSISRKTKARLYMAIVISLMLYNAEVWTPKKQDIKALEAAHFRMLRSMMNVRKEEKVRMKEMLQTFELPTIEHYITQKRMRWVGHALRRDDSDRSKKAVIETLQIEASPWTKLVKKDCKKLKIRWKRLIPLAQNRSSFSKVTHWRIFGS